MWNFLKRLFTGPALDSIVAVALGRVKESLADRNLSDAEKALVNELLETLASEIIKEVRN